MWLRSLALTLALLFTVHRPVAAATLSMNDDGVAVDAGSLGKFTLGYPTLLNQAHETAHKLIEKKPAGKTATVKYEGGSQIDYALDDLGNVSLQFSNMAADVKAMRMEMLVDFGFSQGGKWKINDSEKPFPAEKQASPKLFQGNADNLQLTNYEGKHLTFTIPPFTYQELQDNREWGWKIFDWFSITPFDANWKELKLAIQETKGDQTGPAHLVDRFGQPTQQNYPGKIKDEAELKQDAITEKAYYDALKPPASDRFGGLPGSQAKYGLKATGFFHVEKQGKQWLLVDPDGNAFYHLGVCAFMPLGDYTYVKGREQSYEWLPPFESEYKTAFRPEEGSDSFSFHLANRIRKYGQPYEPQAYTAQMIDRVRKWGFNSGGAFSDINETARNAANFPYVSGLPLSVWQGINDIPGVRETFDPFDQYNRERMDKNFAQSVAPHANDPLIIGYFLSNEPLHEDVPRVIPTLNSKSACKWKLVDMFKAKYQTIDAFNAAWGMTAKSFDELVDAGLPVKTAAAAADMQEFTGQFFEAYYQLIATTFHKYDTHHMLIGNRWQPGTANNEQLCRIAGKYVDVISVNYYTYGVDKDYLTRLYNWTGQRPMILSEFYWNSPSDSGLPGGVKDVKSQQERGLAYRNYIEQTATLGFIVGAEWYTLNDGAYTGFFYGKYNGENPNCGLLNVVDRPWKEMLDHMMQTNYNIYHVLFNEQAPFVYNDSKFLPTGGHKTVKVSRVNAPLQIDGRADGWPNVPPELISGQRVVQGADSGGVEAAWKLSWDDNYLYLIANVTDPTPMQNTYKGDMLWSADGLELFIGSEKPDQPGPLLFTDRQVLLSAGQTDGKPQWFYARSPQQYDLRMAVTPAVDGKGYTLEAAIPWTALALKPHAGQELLFDLAVDDSADGQRRLRQLMWNGTEKNSSDRSTWGRAVLAQ